MKLKIMNDIIFGMQMFSNVSILILGILLLIFGSQVRFMALIPFYIFLANWFGDSGPPKLIKERNEFNKEIDELNGVVIGNQRYSLKKKKLFKDKKIKKF